MEICIDVTAEEKDAIREYLCKPDETVVGAVKRIVISELKSKKLMSDLKYGGMRG